MRDGVEEGSDVEIDHPVLVPTPLTSHSQRVMGAAPTAVAVTVGMKDRLQLVFQQHHRRRLRHPVDRVRHPKHTQSRPMILRYRHTTHRAREIAPRGHPVPQRVEVVLQLRLEPLDADRVDTRCTLVGSDLLPRLENEALVDLKRLHLQLGSGPRLLPCRVGHGLTLVCTAPSLQPHYRAFPATTSRPAPVPRIGTLPLTVSTARGPPSCPPERDR